MEILYSTTGHSVIQNQGGNRNQGRRYPSNRDKSRNWSLDQLSLQIQITKHKCKEYKQQPGRYITTRIQPLQQALNIMTQMKQQENNIKTHFMMRIKVPKK